MRIIYTGPDGQKIKGYGFWDGGSTFKIGCMFSNPGTWTWATNCNHADDSGLHNQTGTTDLEGRTRPAGRGAEMGAYES